MRRVLAVLMAAGLLLALTATGAGAKTEKFTFDDVEVDEQTFEIEAAVKVQKNTSDSVNCSYFTEDYEEHLGSHFGSDLDFGGSIPEADEVLEICLNNFPELDG